jgi:outer membrane protein OmpA-like peptidoglycan-associated protein
MMKRFNFSAGSWRSSAVGMAAALILTGAAVAQTSAPKSKNAVPAEGGYSMLDLDIFGGYQWFQFGQGTSAAIHQYKGAFAWGERLTEEFSNYIAAEEGFQAGYNAFQFRPFGASSLSQAPAGNTQIYVAGVLNLTKRQAKYRPFLLIGPEYVFYKPPNFGSTTIAPGSPGIVFPGVALREQGRTALTYGIGLKINESPRFAVRFDLRGTRSGTPHYGLPGFPSGIGSIYSPGGYVHESSLTASVGLTFRFLYREPIVNAPPPPPPPPPPAPKANVTVGAISGGPASVCAGDNVRLTVTASGWLPDQTPSYQWMIDGSAAPGGTSSSFSVPTAGASGSKSITVKVSAGDSSATSNPFQVTIQPLTPPTVTFGISPSTVPYGTKVTLAANGTGSSCGGPVTIRYAGQGVTGNVFDSTALSFDQSNRLKQQSQSVTITATATDQKNQTASATAPVTVTLTAAARRLDDIVFPLNSARVNNCAKRLLLEELTPMLKNDPDAKVILTGHKDTGEKGKIIDEERVLNATAVLSAGKGICPSLDLSRVMVNWVGTDQNDETRPALCGTSTNVKEKGGQGVKESDKRAQYRRVEIWIVPGGAETPANLTGLKPVPEKEVKAKGCPK